jgi:queuine tRNA-ribosyltransferase
LNAKEMLAWVLLQIHNHHVLNLFFEGVRKSLANDTFENDVRAFERTYQSHLPEKTGQGPRVRGYQYKSEGPGETKKNAVPYTLLEDGRETNAEASLSNAAADAEDLENKGFAKKEE